MSFKTFSIVGFLSIALLAGSTARADADVKKLAADAISDDAGKSTAAIQELRSIGQPGLDGLMNAYAAEIEHHKANPTEQNAGWCRIAGAIDAVAMQKDAWASGLYWFTDLEKAKVAAAAQKKPILSLRLLGTLNTEFSCANSRFFRTALYANTEVSKYLRENYVLHWKSVRPVPKVTIDFGDGRVVERTITGNSIHYVLDAQGKVIDGLPGLYGPAAFLSHLKADYDVHKLTLDRPENAAATLAAWHTGTARQILSLWSGDVAAVGGTVPAASGQFAALQQPPQQPPAAIRAAPIAFGKGRVELKLVRALTPSAEQLAAATDDALWQKIAARHADEARLDEGSRVMIASKNPTALRKATVVAENPSVPVVDALPANPPAAKAGAIATAKWVAESPLVRIARNFERSMAVDTVRNEYLFHSQIHQWLSQPNHLDLDALNEKVYAELFLTPSSDPWLGLLPADAYSALPNDGAKR